MKNTPHPNPHPAAYSVVPQGAREQEQLAVQGKLTEQNTKKKGMPYFTGASDFGVMNPIVTRWTETPKAIAKKSDILLSVKGTVGRVNVLNLPTASIGRQIIAVRPINIETEYLALILRSHEKYFLGLAVGIAILGISRKDVLNLKISLPPLEEQQRIVAKVDALMALCDTLETLLDEQRQVATAFSAAAMQAVTA